jgi:hypothetical protein
VLEGVVTKSRDKKAALKLLEKAMRKFGRLERIVTGMLRFHGAALNGLGADDRQGTGRGLNKRAEISPCCFDDGNCRCSVPGACDVFRNSPPLSPGRVVFIGVKGQLHCPCRDEFELL